MRTKQLLTKTLLVVAVLLAGASSAWATDVPYEIGVTGSNWETTGSYSDSYTLAAGKTLTFTFTVNESAAASGDDDWKGYLLVIQESSTRHTLNANTYTFVRSLCDYNVKGTWNSGALYNNNTYPSGAKYTHFVGADVTMTIKRVGTNVLVTTAITKNATTYYHYYQQNLGTSADLYAFLCADWAKLTLKSAATTDNGLTEETYDFVTPAKALSENVASTYISSVNVNGTSCGILKNTAIDMHDRFAGQNATEWLLQRNNGVYLASGGGRQFGILKLHAGDIIEITFSDVTPTFSGTPNAYIATDGDVSSGTSLISGAAYTIKADGQLNLNSARYIHIQNITIYTNYPVLGTPTITFNSMVESAGVYNPKYSFSSTDDGVTYYDGDGNDISSGYTFTAAGTLTYYAGKTGRTNSAKQTFTITDSQVGMIKANTVNCKSITGIIDYSTGKVFASGRFDVIDEISTSFWKQLIPGLEFNSTYWYVNPSNGIYAGSGSRTMSCSVLNSNRIATLKHYDCSISGEKYDYLTSSGNSVTIKRDGSNYDYLREYNLYVSPSEEVSVTIGSTGYSTFSSPVPLNFAGISGLTAYVAKSVAGGNVTLTSVTTAPANTGLVLKGTAGETYNIPVTNAAEAPASNLLVGCIVETTVAADATSGFNNYVLGIDNEVAKFQSLVTTGATIPAGKAFLKNGAYSAGAPSLSIVFEDGSETTGISASLNDKAEMINDNAIYNLNGQRVAQPTKGLYIVNGKKVVVK